MTRPSNLRALPVFLIALVFAASGCSSTMKLRYERPPAAAGTTVDIGLVVEDGREPARGGNDPVRVGTIRNTFGMPFPLKASPAREPAQVVRELLSDCLAASGFRVVEPTPSTPRLHATLLTFWTDGYQHSRMILSVPMQLQAKEGATPAWSHELDSNTGVTWTAGYGQFDRGFTAMLEEAKGQLLAEFGSPAFRDAYRSLR